MGFYTKYTLTIQEPQRPTVEQIIRELRSVSPGADSALNDDGSTYDEAKWYDHASDLMGLSKRYPDHVFILDGIGEDDERFRLYVKDGKSQRAETKIVYDEFDPAKLK